MKLVTFQALAGGPARLGCLGETGIIDLVELGTAMGTNLPATMLEFVRAGPPARAAARKALEFSSSALRLAHTRAREKMKLLAPLPRPGKILCSGINYHGHLQENPAAKLPGEPFFFAKLPSTVIGPEAPIVIPRRSTQVDYEVELAVVIGQSMSHLAESDVMERIFGYTILHDVSARDVQFKDSQITLGKNFDTFTPIGPCIVTADELTDLSQVGLRTRLNGNVMQDGSTADWVFSLPRLLASLASVMTLEPGDIVTTGTPAGVGYFRQPQVFLRAGDVVELEIAGIGCLRNPVEAA